MTKPQTENGWGLIVWRYPFRRPTDASALDWLIASGRGIDCPMPTWAGHAVAAYQEGRYCSDAGFGPDDVAGIGCLAVPCSRGSGGGGSGTSPRGCGLARYWNSPRPSSDGPCAQRPCALSSPAEQFQ